MIPHEIQGMTAGLTWLYYVPLAVSVLVILVWLVWVARSLFRSFTQRRRQTGE